MRTFVFCQKEFRSSFLKDWPVDWSASGDNLILSSGQTSSSSDDISDSRKSFYMISDTKIRIISDEEYNLKDLVKKYPKLDQNLLQKVYQEQHSWNACLDVLSSIILSHGGVITMEFNSSSNYDEDWPPLEILKEFMRLSLSDKNDDFDHRSSGKDDEKGTYKVSSTDDGWTLFESITLPSLPPPLPHSTSSGGDEDWELVSDSLRTSADVQHPPPPPQPSLPILSLDPSPLPSPTLSYKEILLLPPVAAPITTTPMITASTSSSWTPKIIVDKKLGKNGLSLHSTSLCSLTCHVFRSCHRLGTTATAAAR
jgi:hypothetical protein